MKKTSLLLCALALTLSVSAFAADTTTTPDATTGPSLPATTAPAPDTTTPAATPVATTPARYDLTNYALPSTEGYAVQKQIGVDDMIFSKDITPIVINNTTLVPARAVADALGFTTTWNAGDTPSVTIASKTMTTTLTLGVDLSTASSTVAIGTTAPISYGAPAVLVGNTAYVPVDVFRVIQGNNPAAVTLTDTSVIIKNV